MPIDFFFYVYLGQFGFLLQFDFEHCRLTGKPSLMHFLPFIYQNLPKIPQPNPNSSPEQKNQPKTSSSRKGREGTIYN
jgi:hypothetical protein